MEDIDDLFIKSYLNDINEKEKKKTLVSQEERRIAQLKKDKLQPIEKFLQKFVDLEVSVHHSDKYANTKSSIPGDQKFSFYYVDSSKTWSPGISIWIDHPAVMEIAIPNNPQEEGIVVIKVASHHPDSYLLEQVFHSYESACQAIGRFLAKNTVSVGKDPKKYIKDVEQRKMQSDKQKNIVNIDNQPEPNFNKGHGINEQATLKDSHNGTTLKKIGEFFNIGKNKDENDDE